MATDLWIETSARARGEQFGAHIQPSRVCLRIPEENTREARRWKQHTRKRQSAISSIPVEDHRSVDDDTLIFRCKTGVPGAWDTLIRRYEKRIFQYASALCHNPDDAGDVAVAASFRLFQSLHTFRAESNFASWLYRIVRNIYLDMFTRPRHGREISLDTRAQSDVPGYEVRDPAPSPEQRCLQQGATDWLTGAIRHLPLSQRQPFAMYYLDGSSYEEIAEVTGVPVGTVKSRLHRARKMLHERLAPDQENMLSV